ncbi:hypothetical protein BJF92_09905 [Rhizobium rhizosphaerae]|uniref:Uncharacterized protein n=1 Tax=Xaviernesmea rhizosphaerae TaxID=1672749 RepID=A0A1Q9AGF6_9HYPH|nr:hypothetical protein BJF92_09905 [Xaviernesmea rhizosphaerae]
MQCFAPAMLSAQRAGRLPAIGPEPTGADLTGDGCAMMAACPGMTAIAMRAASMSAPSEGRHEALRRLSLDWAVHAPLADGAWRCRKHHAAAARLERAARQMEQAGG